MASQDDDMYTKMPETVFVFVTTHGSIPVSKNEKTNKYSYKPVKLPKDLILYRINSAAPGVCNISNRLLTKEMKTVLDILKNKATNNKELYESLKSIRERNLNALVLMLQSNLKQLYQKIKLDPLKTKKKKGKPFLHYGFTDVNEQGAHVFNTVKVKAENDIAGITYDKHYAYEEPDPKYPYYSKILALNYFFKPASADQDKQDTYFDLFTYLKRKGMMNYKDKLSLSEILLYFHQLGARKIVLIDLSCFIFANVTEKFIPFSLAAPPAPNVAAVAKEYTFRADPRNFPVPVRDERELRRLLLHNKLSAKKDKHGDYIAGGRRGKNTKKRTKRV